jgi:hypothetical protein
VAGLMVVIGATTGLDDLLATEVCKALLIFALSPFPIEQNLDSDVGDRGQENQIHQARH